MNEKIENFVEEMFDTSYTTGEPSNLNKDWLRSALTTLLSATEARVRAETLEEVQGKMPKEKIAVAPNRPVLYEGVRRDKIQQNKGWNSYYRALCEVLASLQPTRSPMSRPPAGFSDLPEEVKQEFLNRPIE
jgi:hypothetical protein